ncbi:MAG: DUF1906 domain-containing protein [Actinophytocola sp.]|nr:DUF1906 domain-containing protein [Actinophytocola sp.]
MHRARRAVTTVAALVLGASLATAPVASAEPATTVRYPKPATTTPLVGLAFDTCTAPTVDQMRAWRSSPYRGVGVYIGGPNRTCAQPELTADWVDQVSRMPWRIIPIYMGRQAPCTFRGPGSVNINPDLPKRQGVASARDAIAQARAIGLTPGSAIYGDMEHYDANQPACRRTVLRYLTGWTKELHRNGYLSGVYAHLYSGAKHLSEAYHSTAYARPDALWIARWDGDSSLSGWQDIPDNQWARGQRGKQYRGDHNETHGGVTLNIDSDRFHAPVATVSRTFRVTSTSPLNARSGPSPRYPVVRTHAPGSTVWVRCQLPGAKFGSTNIWDKLAAGTYVTDYYVSTRSQTGYSWPIPKCLLPYQVTAQRFVTKRAGPGTGYRAVGTLPAGALARVHCQRAGQRVGSTRVWNKLNDGTWVTDYYVATPNTDGFSWPIPRC